MPTPSIRERGGLRNSVQSWDLVDDGFAWKDSQNVGIALSPL